MKRGEEQIKEEQIKEEQIKEFLLRCQAPDMGQEQRGKLFRTLKMEMARKRLVPRRSLGRSLWEQARFISPAAWVLQTVFLVFAVVLAGAGDGWYLWRLASVIPFFGVICVPEITKSFCCGMWELEESCLYNLKRVMAMKLMIFGIVDGISLLLLAATAGRAGAGIGEAVLFILVPFNCSNAVYLWLFTVMGRRENGYLMAAIGLLMAAGSTILGYYVPNPLLSKAWLAAVAGIVSLAVLGAGIYRLISRMESEESEKWSFE